MFEMLQAASLHKIEQSDTSRWTLSLQVHVCWVLSGDADKVPTERAYSNNDPWDRKGEIISTGKATARGRVIAHEFLPEPDICLTDGEIDKSYPLVRRGCPRRWGSHNGLPP